MMPGAAPVVVQGNDLPTALSLPVLFPPGDQNFSLLPSLLAEFGC
jgi:hypothetical protein